MVPVAVSTCYAGQAVLGQVCCVNSFVNAKTLAREFNFGFLVVGFRSNFFSGREAVSQAGHICHLYR